MKTILEWANELPEDVREAFVRNTSAADRLTKEKSLSDAVREAFIWDESPEDFTYWDSVDEWSRRKTGTCPPLPKTT